MSAEVMCANPTLLHKWSQHALHFSPYPWVEMIAWRWPYQDHANENTSLGHRIVNYETEKDWFSERSHGTEAVHQHSSLYHYVK